ncbi:thiamine-phosphate kinase [Endomicrobium proavitum]|uniref:Thiamine-monophosphate kinase n=1 Tax=Endomicrobium proavitum TaxID=1408281 RepID=A0A0G3WHQ3_9BACT|nr:thiamine-phosphate kinase [Endomicrobium proavitum]AKL97435.1 Thiamine-monophosphate kinase [Endomicrobium proavitum]
MSNKTISSVGEFGFINIIKKKFALQRRNKQVSVPIGDDCFCFKSGGINLCVTKDMLVEDVHFKKEWTYPQELGAKAVEVNVSDAASMGGALPKYIFIGLGLPPETDFKYVEKIYQGIKNACAKYKILLAGGDSVKSDKIIISVTVIAVGGKNIVQRTGAKAGDLIGVTNTFGNAGAGVELLYKYAGKRKFNKEEKYLIKKQNSPQARLKEAGKIAKYLTSMTDASDGLYVSLDLIAAKAGANIALEKIPLSKELKNVFKDKQKQINLALFGAEDFELVFTVAKSKAAAVKKLVPTVSYIGEITDSKKVKYFYNGKEQKIKYAGFKHF